MAFERTLPTAPKTLCLIPTNPPPTLPIPSSGGSSRTTNPERRRDHAPSTGASWLHLFSTLSCLRIRIQTLAHPQPALSQEAQDACAAIYTDVPSTFHSISSFPLRPCRCGLPRLRPHATRAAACGSSFLQQGLCVEVTPGIRPYAWCHECACIVEHHDNVCLL